MAKKKRQIQKGTGKRFQSQKPAAPMPSQTSSIPKQAAPTQPTGQQTPGLGEVIGKMYADFVEKNPGASVTDFYRLNATALWQAAEKATGLGEQAILTPEGHPVLYAKSTYFIQSDQTSVMDSLNTTLEFAYAGPKPKEPGSYVFNWLLRGRSQIQRETSVPPLALQLSAEIQLDGVDGKFLILGEVSVFPGRVVLETLSPERLEAGKALLEATLGFQIRPWRDHYKTPEDLLESAIDNLPPIEEPEEDEFEG